MLKLFDEVGNNFIYYFMTTEPKNESKKNKNKLESKSIETSLNSEENFSFQNSKEFNINEEEVDCLNNDILKKIN